VSHINTVKKHSFTSTLMKELVKNGMETNIPAAVRRAHHDL